jgi:hypothetical protein
MCFVSFNVAISRLYRIVTYCFLHQGELVWNEKKRHGGYIDVVKTGRAVSEEQKRSSKGLTYRCISTKLHGFTFHIDQYSVSTIFVFFFLFIMSLSFALSCLRLNFPSFCPDIFHPFLSFSFLLCFLLFSLFLLILLLILFYILCVLP